MTSPPEICRIDDKVCEGDKANPASFFGDAYFPKNNLEIPIVQLRLLAAHSVLMAGRLNPEYIEGLESTSEGFRKLTPKEIKELSSISVELHGRTKEHLFGSNQVATL